jgi:catechol 2,3-dioxygenase
MAIVRVGFLELWVRDLDRSLEFYQGLLGLRLEHREGKSAYLRGYEELEWSLKLTQAPFPAVRALEGPGAGPDLGPAGRASPPARVRLG